jgi:hypothetical protein
MLIFNSPKSDVLLATRNQLICLDGAEFDCKDVKIANLFSQ